MSDERLPVYVEDGRVIYRASAVGMCEEALLALRQGMGAMMPPEWFQEKLDEGTEAEEEIVNAGFGRHGLDLVHAQEEVEVAITDNILIRGHTDGRGRDDEELEAGLEAKKLGPSLWKKWDSGLASFWSACPYYRDQLTVYMHGSGLPFLYAVGQWDPDEKKIVQVQTKLIPTPPGDINEIKARVLRVEARFMGSEVPECDGKGMWPCPVYYLHDEEEREQVEDEELEEAVAQYLDARDVEKDARSNKEAAMRRIKELMEDQPEKVQVSNATLSKYTHVSTRPDKEALKKAGIDLTPYMNRTETPSVKVVAKEE